ncbi:MAG: Hsp70 family protein [Spirochaetes bacterium]|nr:Hsp70 family protein [Spirochaetota bacterium]
MYVANTTGPVPCPVCGAPLNSGAIVACGQCGSELNLENPSAVGTVVKRGSTSAGRRVVEVVTERFLRSDNVNLSADAMAMQRLTEASERVARELVTIGKAVVDLPFITAGPSGPVSLKMKLERKDIG